jgi:hypothetical protein
VSFYIAWLELTVLLPQPPQYWDYNKCHHSQVAGIDQYLGSLTHTG